MNELISNLLCGTRTGNPSLGYISDVLATLHLMLGDPRGPPLALGADALVGRVGPLRRGCGRGMHRLVTRVLLAESVRSKLPWGIYSLASRHD